MKHFDRRQPSLKRVYDLTFACLVVVPLMTVFLGAMAFINHQLRASSIENIKTFQENIASVLSDDINSAALQLSHFVYTNDGEFMDLAQSITTSSGSQQYNLVGALGQAFQTAMVPSQSILAGSFYMKTGDPVYMKDDVVVTPAEIGAAGWYRAAQQKPNTVTVGGYDTSKTRVTLNSQKSHQLVLATALCPNQLTDKSGNIDMVVFFTVSHMGDVLKSARRNETLGSTVLLDAAGNLLFSDSDSETLAACFAQCGPSLQLGENTLLAAPNGGKPAPYLFMVRQLPGCDWRAVTFVRTQLLTKGLDRFGGMLTLVIAGLLGLFFLFSRYFLNSIVTPVHTVAEGMGQLVNNDLNVQIRPTGQPEIRSLMESFNQMVLSLKNMLMVNEEAQKRKHKAEIQALQSQINPHFIVNTLNSIRFMAQVAGYAGIQKMAESLINIVSCSFRSNVSFYTLREELEVLDSYIYLMRIRYADSFEVVYAVQPDCLAYKLPRLTLQPIVENSITHAFTDLEEELGQIQIGACREGEFLCLSIRDNGKGMEPAQIQQVLRGRPRAEDDNTSIGLENVLARIRLNFGEKAQMQIESEPGHYTRTTIRLPWPQQPAAADPPEPAGTKEAAT